MTQEIRIISSVYRSLADILGEAGQLPADISDQAGVNLANLSTPQQMLTLQQVSELWKLGFEACGDQIGLEVAKRVRLIDFQDVGVFFTATENVADLLHQLSNYCALFSNVVEFNAIDLTEGLAVEVHYSATVDLLHERLDFLSLAGRTLASEYLATPLSLASVQLTRPKPTDTTPWDEAFGVKVKWGAPITRYEISEQEALRPILTRNEQIKKELKLLLDHRLLSQQTANPLDEIRLVMTKQFVRSVPTVDSVAKALHVSRRTLQRKLTAGGSTFNDLLNALREDMAKKYIQLGMSSETVSQRLGYSDLSTFNRAFKRWTGMTPAQFNKQSQ